MAHLKTHKIDCKSPYIKETWRPSWDREGRCPAFMGTKEHEVGSTPFGGSQYMWGNMPALDLLKLDQNEGKEVSRDYALLFAGKTATLILLPQLNYRSLW